MTITPEDLVRQNVHYCVSGLVAMLARGLGEIADKDCNSLAEQAFELAAPIDDWEEAAIQRGWTQSPDGWCWRAPDDTDIDPDFYFLGSGPFVQVAGDMQDACAYDGLEPYCREVYEHWIVSDWLAGKLEQHGEKVDRDFAGLTVWARTTTGQVIYSDSVIERICEELGK